MPQVKRILKISYKKNLTLLKWAFAIVVTIGLVVVPVLSAFLAL